MIAPGFRTPFDLVTELQRLFNFIVYAIKALRLWTKAVIEGCGLVITCVKLRGHPFLPTEIFFKCVVCFQAPMSTTLKCDILILV